MSRTSENKIRSLLQKWLSGDTTRQEESRLESLAKEDAFLAEAMEGYRQFPEGQHEERLARLSTKLNKRKEQQRPLTFYLSRAAAVILFLVIAGIGIDRFFSPDSPELGDVIKVEGAKESKSIEHIPTEEVSKAIEEEALQKDLNPEAGSSTALNSSGHSDEDVVSPLTSNSSSKKRRKTENKIQASPEPSAPAAAPPVVADTDLSPPVQPTAKPEIEADTPVSVQGSRAESTDYYVDGVRVQSAGTVANAKDSAQTVDAIVAADEPIADEAVEDSYAITEELAPSKEALDNAGSVYSEREQKKKDESVASRQKRTAADDALRQIQGLVQDAATQDPIPFANVIIPGTKDGTVTDIDGKFALNVAPSTQQLAVSYLGYEEQMVELGKSDQIEVLLNESNVTLSEVTVAGYSKKAKEVKAKPKKGVKKYKKYIDQNRVYPEAAKAAGIKGEVSIEFIVGEDGRPTELKISQSLGYGCDEEALRLIREGPDWKGTGVRTEYKISFGQ